MKSYQTPTLMSVVMVTRPPQKLRNVLIWKCFIRGIKEDRLWRSEARQIICSLSRHHFYITRFPAGCHSVTHICERMSKVHGLRTLDVKSSVQHSSMIFSSEQSQSCRPPFVILVKKVCIWNISNFGSQKVDYPDLNQTKSSCLCAKKDKERGSLKMLSKKEGLKVK